MAAVNEPNSCPRKAPDSGVMPQGSRNPTSKTSSSSRTRTSSRSRNETGSTRRPEPSPGRSAKAREEEKKASRSGTTTTRNGPKSQSRVGTTTTTKGSKEPNGTREPKERKSTTSRRNSQASESARSKTKEKPQDTQPLNGHHDGPEPEPKGLAEPASRSAELSPNGRRLWDKDHIVTDMAEEADEDIADYEDDFEDYDDDFEEDIDEGEVEQDDGELKLDSGSYERKSAMDRAKREKEMSEVKKALIRENSARPHRQEVTAESEAEPTVVRRPPSGRGFINFSSAKQRQKTIVAAGKAAKRGDKLLQMIRLDIMSFDLFELPPVRYEAFMKTFGASNTLQASSQTGENNLDEEVQTETTKMLDKWTQHPPAAMAVKDLDDHELLAQAIKGVGGDFEPQTRGQESWEFANHSNSLRLSKFLGAAVPALLTLLEEESASASELEGQVQRDVEFSDKVTILKTEDFPFLKARPILALVFAPGQAATLLTAHGSLDQAADGDEDDFTHRNYLCIWNISHPSAPQKVLTTYHNVASLCFSPFKASIAFAGLIDGTLCAWDLREATSMHQEVTRQVVNDQHWIIRSPTFTTTSILDSHRTKISSCKCLPEPQEEALATGEESSRSGFNAFQLVSSEEKGVVIVWTVLDSQHDFDQHIGLAHWGSIRMVKSMTIELSSLTSQSEMGAFDITFDPESGSSIFIASDNGTVLHGSVHQEHRPNPRAFKAEYDTLSSCTSLAYCPYKCDGYLLIASDDGTIRLHSIGKERPLMVWPGSVDGEPILKIVWSQSRPCVFFVLDSGSRIHLWDLGSGDIYPAHSVDFDEEITAMDINPELTLRTSSTSRSKQLLALGMASGKVEVHHLMAEYQSKDEDACRRELGRFLHYVSLI